MKQRPSGWNVANYLALMSRCIKTRICLKDDELLQVNPGFRKRIMRLNPGLGTRRNKEEGAAAAVNETVGGNIRKASGRVVIELAVSSVSVFEACS